LFLRVPRHPKHPLPSSHSGDIIWPAPSTGGHSSLSDFSRALPPVPFLGERLSSPQFFFNRPTPHLPLILMMLQGPLEVIVGHCRSLSPSERCRAIPYPAASTSTHCHSEPQSMKPCREDSPCPPHARSADGLALVAQLADGCHAAAPVRCMVFTSWARVAPRGRADLNWICRWARPSEQAIVPLCLGVWAGIGPLARKYFPFTKFN
jgi:hypothetical protein